jgi:nucleoside-diphosphate-sugar epimerase
MKVLLFGAGGRIGKLVDALLVSRSHEVFIARRVYSETAQHLEYTPGQKLNIDSGMQVDIIINSSGKYFVSPTSEQASVIHQSTVEVATSIKLTNQILDASILNLSTYFQYLPSIPPEISNYTIAKASAHRILLESSVSQKNSYMDLVLMDNFGSTSNHKFFDALLLNTKLQTPMKCSNMQTPINLIHIDDLVRGIVTAAETLFELRFQKSQVSRSLINSDSYKLIDLANLVSSASERPSILEWGALAPRIPSDFAMDCLPKKLEGWSIKISVEQYIANFFCK